MACKSGVGKNWPIPFDQRKKLNHGDLAEVRSQHYYFWAAKKSHVDMGHSWSEQLGASIKAALRSCMRGVGPRQKNAPAKEAFVFPRRLSLFFAHFACQEVNRV